MKKTDLDGIDEHEVGFRTADGLRVAVSSGKKKMDDGSVHLKVQARVVDEAGETLSRPPANGRTVHVDGLTNGTVDLADELADETRKAVERAANHHEAMQAYDDLPIPEEG